jgi:hypothetical protein
MNFKAWLREQAEEIDASWAADVQAGREMDRPRNLALEAIEHIEWLEQSLEAADAAWEGLKQTQLAASAVGLEIAQGLREGYGLNLTIALRAATQPARP